ncbi:hypothetical protein AKJ50_01320 [candidate division MSBL1 archaeon SCGC-AAA382A13]|uniref:Tyr recombinase domain-containing protein n=1 Tax=candidate division MSBL1 archaeon SCGC-AAA382A13 TaxID=1698279 RepID=A0A133VFR6_9EURY|nr:hypothetical protein AKJ50_01320 [candidate division MSBL1 archaeon SCGC-AAA382A13]
MSEKRKRNPFGHGDPHDPLSLREFEVELGIKSREGGRAWKSELPSVQNLLDHLQRYSGSEGTKDEYLRMVHRLCEFSGRNPEELIESEKEKIESLVQEFADRLAGKDCSKTYVNSAIRRLLTFFRQNGHDHLDVETHHVPSRYSKRSEHIPKKEEVHKMAKGVESHRNRSIVYLLWTTGLRVSTLVALNYGDIREELDKGEEHVKVPVYPEMKERVSDACKGEIPYYTFAHPLAIRPLKHYLRKRRNKYGPLEDEYPLLHSNWNHWSRDERNRKRLDRRSVQRVVKTAAERAGLLEWDKISPHCLRKAFKSVLRAPTKNGGRLDEGTQEYLMGHILPGTQDEYYDKGNVDFHREEYAKLDFSDNQSMQRIEEKEAEEVEGPDKVVKKGKLSEYLGRGWVYLEKIDDEQFIIRKAEASNGVKT